MSACVSEPYAKYWPSLFRCSRSALGGGLLASAGTTIATAPTAAAIAAPSARPRFRVCALNMPIFRPPHARNHVARRRQHSGLHGACTFLSHERWLADGRGPSGRFAVPIPGRGAVWLARLTGGQEVGGSNPLGPTGNCRSGAILRGWPLPAYWSCGHAAVCLHTPALRSRARPTTRTCTRVPQRAEWDQWNLAGPWRLRS